MGIATIAGTGRIALAEGSHTQLHGFLGAGQLAELLTHSLTPTAVLRGPDHRIEFVNDAYVGIVRRLRPDELLGRTMREARADLVGQGFIEQLDEVYRTGKSYVGKAMPADVLSSATGETARVFYDVFYHAITDADGAVTGVMMQGMDVTDHVLSRQQSERREAALTQQWRQLAEMYRTAPVGFAMYEPKEFRMIAVNEKLLAMLNVPAEALMGRSVLDFAGEIDGVRQRFETVAAGGHIENVVIEGVLASQPGVYRSWLVNYSPLFGPDGDVQAISTVSLDVTAQKLAEGALIKSEKLAAVGRLASSIAHEINNPLESVTNLLYLSRHMATDEEQAGYLKLADQELRRVANIVNQTLRFHKQATSATHIGGAALLSTVLSIYEGRLKNSGIKVEPTMKTDLEVRCLEGEIRQVLNNLVGNAIDAMPTGGRLLLRCRAGTNWRTGKPGLVITVADTGTGMSEETRKKLFDAFYTTKGIGGTGLGLWISAEIVERHGGRMLVRSRQSGQRHGTVMTLFLPECPATSH